MIRAAVVGATGYTGEELIQCLERHPKVELTSISALVYKEVPFSKLYPKYEKRVSLVCKNLDVDEVSKKSDVVFLALPHTVSMTVVPKLLKDRKKVIDLSADYRLPVNVYEKWYKTKHVDFGNISSSVYGLPEINRHNLKNANLVANPGCYPTSAILALLPIIKIAAKHKPLIIVDSKSGVTGAGKKGTIPLSFGEISDNFKCYKANEHQHMPEIEHILSGLAETAVYINFVPHLLPIRRGILSTVYLRWDGNLEESDVYEMYVNRFKDEPFVRVRPQGEMPEIKDVAYTNFCDLGIKCSRDLIIIVSVIDNLLKGASGQAVQNMNIMFGMDERLGLA